MAADLELVIDPADEDELTIRTQPDQIARPVSADIPAGQGQRDEALRRQFRPSEIPERQRVADQMKLSGFANDGGAHARQRQADGDLFPLGRRGRGGRDGRDYRRLGRAIGVKSVRRSTALRQRRTARERSLAADETVRTAGGGRCCREIA